MNTNEWTEFEVSVPLATDPVCMRMRDCGGRWTASVDCGTVHSDGLGAGAREALVAALTPLGARMVTAVMSAPVMFAASAQVLPARAAL